MLFSYDSAIRELKRCRESGDNHTKLKRVWYGWILVDEITTNARYKNFKYNLGG